MDLRQMRYFLALAQERNFSRAAERLHMAQPPLTRQIRLLEEQLGITLFVRTAKGVDLTEAGQTLLDELPNVLSLAQRAEERARLAGKGLIGRLDVGIFGSGVLNVIPLLLAHFHAARPEVQIVIHNLTKVEQIQALREHRITIAISRLPPNESDLRAEVVLREGLLVGLHEGHRLCAKTQISVRDLDNEPMILYPNVPTRGLAQEIISAFVREGVRLRIEQEVEDVLTCVALVSCGFGLCITTESTANLHLPHVVYRPLKSRYLRDIDLSCLYRRDDNSPILTAFLSVVGQFPKKRTPK